jgi:hypothetical protein
LNSHFPCHCLPWRPLLPPPYPLHSWSWVRSPHFSSVVTVPFWWCWFCDTLLVIRFCCLVLDLGQDLTTWSGTSVSPILVRHKGAELFIKLNLLDRKKAWSFQCMKLKGFHLGNSFHPSHVLSSTSIARWMVPPNEKRIALTVMHQCLPLKYVVCYGSWFEVPVKLIQHRPWTHLLSCQPQLCAPWYWVFPVLDPVRTHPYYDTLTSFDSKCDHMRSLCGHKYKMQLPHC